MGQIYGNIEINCNFIEKIDGKQFKKFQLDLEKAIENWEFTIYDLAEKNGFKSEDIHPIMLDNLYMENDNE